MTPAAVFLISMKYNDFISSFALFKFSDKYLKIFFSIFTESNLMSKNGKSNPSIGLNINIIPIKNINYGKTKSKQILKQKPNKMKMNLNQKHNVEIYKSKFLKTDKEIINSHKKLNNNTNIKNTTTLNN